MIQGDTELTPNQGPTYASLTIQDGGMQIRRAAATARAALLDQAASRLKVTKECWTYAMAWLRSGMAARDYRMRN